MKISLAIICFSFLCNQELDAQPSTTTNNENQKEYEVAVYYFPNYHPAASRDIVNKLKGEK